MYLKASKDQVGRAILLCCIGLPLAASAPSYNQLSHVQCRYLPGDPQWPSDSTWNELNTKVGGKLITGVPLATSCSGTDYDIQSCTVARDDFTELEPYYHDPVNVMSMYWLNNTCAPWRDPTGSCGLGNLASYAINVDGAEAVKAGLEFARDNNIRLTVKNTGHDFLGRSTGKGALELWTHNLKNISFFNYNSSAYSGPAAKLGAGVQAFEAYQAASNANVQIVGGSCDTVGLAGGFYQGGGHGPLGSAHGLGADNTLEFEVVTADGRHLTASATQNPDLYWALSGGGAGNYAVVLSITVKTFPDGPMTGANFIFANTNDDTFWVGVSAWLKYQLVLDKIPGWSSLWEIAHEGFRLSYVTLPGSNESLVQTALQPFFNQLQALNISTISYNTGVSPGFYQHFKRFNTDTYTTNSSQGNNLVSRDTVQRKLPQLIAAMRRVTNDNTTTGVVAGVSNNYQRTQGKSAVLPAWRDALFTMNMAAIFEPEVSSTELARIQKLVNRWQSDVRAIAPTDGSYMNEATYDARDWKTAYYGSTYDKLLAVKNKYDPQHLFWASVAVGSDTYWTSDASGRLCRV